MFSRGYPPDSLFIEQIASFIDTYKWTSCVAIADFETVHYVGMEKFSLKAGALGDVIGF